MFYSNVVVYSSYYTSSFSIGPQGLVATTNQLFLASDMRTPPPDKKRVEMMWCQICPMMIDLRFRIHNHHFVNGLGFKIHNHHCAFHHSIYDW
jgi:hypothetical protein